MTVNTYVKRKIMEKDLDNLIKTKTAIWEHLEKGTPLVPKFEEKIRKYCEKYSLTRAEVVASIMSDTVAASTFSKSANRQRTAEKAQLDYLRLVRGVRIKSLPGSGHGSIRLDNGELVMGNVPKTSTSTKTLDAVSDNNHTTDYLYVKFTSGSGGSQDNQAMDAVRFLEAAEDYILTHDDRVRFVAVLDGDYYDRHWDVFTDYRSNRILVETSDTYKVRGRKALYFTSKGVITPRAKTV